MAKQWRNDTWSQIIINHVQLDLLSPPLNHRHTTTLLSPSMPPSPSPSTKPSSNNSKHSSKIKPPNGPYANPTPYQLRSLVMDYLCQHCYTRTAVAFARDSTVRHLDADGDEILQPREKGILGDRDILELSKETLKQAELRNEIRIHILSGNVDDAIELLNEHFPDVLAFTDTPASPSDSTRSTPTEKDATTSKHIIPTTIDPRHLLLNLRILGFTELCRSRPLIYASPSLRTSDIDMDTTNLDADGNPMSTDIVSEEDTNTSSGGSYDDPIVDDPRVSKLVGEGRKLYELLALIDNPAERDLYGNELINVGALMAYPKPEDGPLAAYLSMERRESVADQINKAILVRMGQSPASLIELIARQTSVLWSIAHDIKLIAKPGVILPPRDRQQSTPSPSAPNRKQSESDSPIVPAFNLQTFLGP